MKWTFTFLFFVLYLHLHGQSRVVERLYDQYGDSGCFSISLTGNFLSGFCKEGAREDEDWQQVAAGIKNVRLLRVPGERYSASRFNNLRKELLKERFEELIAVNDPGSKVYVLVKEQKKTISQIIMIVNDKDGLLVLDMKGELPKNKVKEFMENIDVSNH